MTTTTNRSAWVDHDVQNTAAYPQGEPDGSHLTPLELEWLTAIPSSWSMSARPTVDYMTDTRTDADKAREWTPAHLSHASAVVVYRGEHGIAMGAVRSRTPKGTAGRTEDTFEVSPFPGAWEWAVKLSDILLVRHPQTI